MPKKILPLLSLIILILMSCVTDEDAVRELPEYNETVLNKIEKYLEDGEPERALHLINSISDERLEDKKSSAEKAVISKVKKAVGNKNYESAAEYQKSADAAGLETGFETGYIYLQQVLADIAEEGLSPALLLFYNEFIYNQNEYRLSNEDAAVIMDAAVETKNKTVLEYLRTEYPEVAGEKSSEIEAVLNYRPGTEELINGTVTIWVNRGIKIEKGLGYPDRIIGSGFYIDKRGYIITNYHVIASEVDTEYEGYSRLYVKIDQNQEKIPARVIGWDASLDIALLKVEIEPEYVYNFSDYKNYKPGQKIYAIGSPGGLEKTITSGIISASGNRRLLPIGDTIQVDVPINSGNSGGPVIDEAGNLVGVVFAGIEQFEGVNFIIPAKWIIQNLTELYNEGKNRQSWLGFTVHENDKSLEITYVMPGTSAFITKIRSGDRILSIDGKKVGSIPEAQEAVQDKMPGTLININVESSGTAREVMLVVEPRDDMPMKKALELDSRKNLMPPFFGMEVISGDEKIIGQEYIIKKVYRGTTADETGLSVDDPFSVVSWEVDDEYNIILVGIRIKKKKAGFLETVIQLGNYIDINTTV